MRAFKWLCRINQGRWRERANPHRPAPVTLDLAQSQRIVITLIANPSSWTRRGRGPPDDLHVLIVAAVA